MRNEEKEIKNIEKIIEIFSREKVCRIAFKGEKFPYILPVHFVYVKDCFYFHSADKGRKIDLMEIDGRVCFEVDKLIEIKSNKQACSWNTKYQSVIGTGTAIVVKDLKEKMDALSHLMEKYSGNKNWDIPREKLKKVTVIRVNISSITGKSSK